MPTSSDTVLRAMTNDGAFRVITAKTTQTTQGVLSVQRPESHTRQTFADLLTGVVLVRETMAPQLRVQGILKRSTGGGALVADSHPSGDTRGLSGFGKAPDLDAEGIVLQMMRTLHDGRLHQGIVSVPDDSDVSQALMTYMQISEQVTTMIAVGTLFDEDQPVSSGGYLVQLLPEVGRGPLAVMTERLEDFRSIDQQLSSPDFSPEALLEELLYAMPYTVLGDSPVRYRCWCSATGVLGALASLPRSDIEEMISDGKTLEINCEYCASEYHVAPGELRGLLETS